MAQPSTSATRHLGERRRVLLLRSHPVAWALPVLGFSHPGKGLPSAERSEPLPGWEVPGTPLAGDGMASGYSTIPEPARPSRTNCSNQKPRYRPVIQAARGFFVSVVAPPAGWNRRAPGAKRQGARAAGRGPALVGGASGLRSGPP